MKLSCFVTSTYKKDLPRIRLQRKSLNVLASGIPQFMGVESEDYLLFKEEFKNEKDLHIFPTSELLPAHLEKLRSASRIWHVHPGIWDLSKRIRKNGYFDGYLSQQLVKLHLALLSGFETSVVLDSDSLVVSEVTSKTLSDNCYIGGKPWCPFSEPFDGFIRMAR